MGMSFSDMKNRLQLTDYQKCNNLVEVILLERYFNVYMNRFEYTDLPEEIPHDIIDRSIFWYRNSCFFKNSVLGFVALPPAMRADLNVYWRPTKWSVIGGNGFHEELNDKNSVLIWNDNARTCPYWHIITEVKRMANLIQTTDININAQKTPFIAGGEKDQLLTAANTYEQITGNKMVLFLSKKKAQELKETSVFQTGVEFKGLEFEREIQIIENKILTYLGINNVNVEKRERLVTDEANANSELTQLNLEIALQTRRDCIDKINKMFGTNIGVELRKRQDFETDGGIVDGDVSSLTDPLEAAKKGDK